MYYTGLLIALLCFLIIGVFHPIVIHTEYRWGVRPWWVFLVVGLACVVSALFVADAVASSVLGILGATCLWTIKELFEQRDRVRKGWFKMNPKRRHEYGPPADAGSEGQGDTACTDKGFDDEHSANPNW